MPRLRYLGPDDRVALEPEEHTVLDRDGAPVEMTEEQAALLESLPGQRFERVDETPPEAAPKQAAKGAQAKEVNG